MMEDMDFLGDIGAMEGEIGEVGFVVMKCMQKFRNTEGGTIHIKKV